MTMTKSDTLYHNILDFRVCSCDCDKVHAVTIHAVPYTLYHNISDFQVLSCDYDKVHAVTIHVVPDTLYHNIPDTHLACMDKHGEYALG